MTYQLTIGNKNYSSWSMRPWVLLRQFGIPFEERMVRFDSFDTGSHFRSTIDALNPFGKVPLLQDGDLLVSDSLAIAEYLAEQQPDLALWPRDRAMRALARSLCAEMHAGFSALRNHCPMNIEAHLPEVGERLMATEPDVKRDLQRVDAVWSSAVARSGGPFLFGEFTIADAYYAPVVSRLRTYALPVSESTARYMDAVWSAPGVAAWVAEALEEHDFVPFDEPYRQSV